MVEATISVVRVCCAYASVDNQTETISKFLSMQPYVATDATSAGYTLTFDLHGEAFARVLVDAKLQMIDLADLYGSPWSQLSVVGFHRVWLSRPDWRDLTPEDIDELEQVVTDDLLFDYGEDEMELQFEDSYDPAYVVLTVSDL